ncbi:NUDIX domain-containing protein [Reyranella sp. CPCC 100927]|uniref:NUDIX domain-containing protein n=1 Tax=Reyranella sp. CPCC 100927 TaxID=2599616 RepID=UPI0011B52E24|nr:NUDIX domain-containing protein [Reyranella sp. CPCC 100927]TWT00264.1 NUDIX domain-containing protein [Reyranella sp. CPCC 100927]
MPSPSKLSAGLLVFRHVNDAPEVLLAHPGGPFWARKDDGAWSIPKGLCEPGEAVFAAARREFVEETGLQPDGDFIELTPVKQPGGKVVAAWAVDCDLDVSGFRSNTFQLEWPPRSGKFQDVPEIDRVAWFTVPVAQTKILKGQKPLLDQLMHLWSMKTP